LQTTQLSTTKILELYCFNKEIHCLYLKQFTLILLFELIKAKEIGKQQFKSSEIFFKSLDQADDL
jgi:hypothetical protein